LDDFPHMHFMLRSGGSRRARWPRHCHRETNEDPFLTFRGGSTTPGRRGASRFSCFRPNQRGSHKCHIYPYEHEGFRDRLALIHLSQGIQDHGRTCMISVFHVALNKGSLEFPLTETPVLIDGMRACSSTRRLVRLLIAGHVVKMARPVSRGQPRHEQDSQTSDRCGRPASVHQGGCSFPRDRATQRFQFCSAH
jgi:hypothetical protein